MTTRLRRLLVGVSAAVLLLVVMAGALDLWAMRRVEAAVARLEPSEAWLHEGTLTVPAVPEGENRARAFRAAAALIDLAPLGDQRTLGSLVRGMPSERETGPIAADLRAVVDASRGALRVADEARTRSRSNWEGDYLADASGSRVPWNGARTLSNLLYLAARRGLDDGRADDAALAMAAGLALSASVRHEPSLVAQLVRCAFGMQHFGLVQRLLSQTEPSKASLDELARLLAEDREPRPSEIGLRAEMTHYHAVFVRRDVAAPWGFARAWQRLDHARYLETLGELLDSQMGPRPRPALEPPAPPRWLVLTGTAQLALPALYRTMETSDLFTTQHGLVELGVALSRYRLDHGRYPDELPALMPDFIVALPIDASTGRPPVYTREGTGFRLRADALDWGVPR